MQEKIYNVIEFTNRSIFLTGKAGTGKTTFLNNFVKNTAKKIVVVAPTGIAAINAGGVTIHSMFGLPLTTFLPTTNPVDRNEAINIPQLLPHFKYRKDKLKLLQALELLIIDEVSMLRADVLDMIDLSLKSARRSSLPFGGVQLLLIGDLYQLPPVVREQSAAILNSFYASPYFFESKALQLLPFITVELRTIYRQNDPIFITLLNAIRNGDSRQINFELLNSRYQPLFEENDEYVHLVSHNYMAATINAKHLKELPAKPGVCKAIVNGDFKESMFPNDPEMILKKDARVMFIRNDKSEEKKYYNGRLATVVKVEADKITVLPDDAVAELVVEREVWENKKYFLDDQKEIQEDVVGSFEQFPLRLAWAVTIHKSQGLTFDKVIVDAGKSFTSGQVYVALSRCRTLEGIVLKSPIRSSNIFPDHRIAAFHDSTNASEKIDSIYEEEKNDFAISRLLQVISLSKVLAAMEDWMQAGEESKVLPDGPFTENAANTTSVLNELEATYNKFEQFIYHQAKAAKNNWPIIENKSIGAVDYFFSKIKNNVFEPFKLYYSETKGVKGLKSYNEAARVFLEELENYLIQLKSSSLLDRKLFKQEAGAEPIRITVTKKPSHIISYELLEAEKTPQQIAEERNLSISTIYGHFAKVAAVGILNIKQIFSEEQLMKFKTAFDNSDLSSLTNAKQLLPDFEFHELRVLLNHFGYLKKKVAKGS